MILAPTPEAIAAGPCPRRKRFAGRPGAGGLERKHGPLVPALRQDAFLLLCPGPPLTLAKDRDAFTPSPAQDEPPAAELPRERRRTPRDPLKPRTPQRPAMRARAPRVAPRRRLVGDHVRLTTPPPPAPKPAAPPLPP